MILTPSPFPFSPFPLLLCSQEKVKIVIGGLDRIGSLSYPINGAQFSKQSFAALRIMKENA